MARIKIDDLPQDVQISREEMKKVFGGLAVPAARIPILQQQFLTPGSTVMGYYSCECCNFKCDCPSCGWEGWQPAQQKGQQVMR